MKHLVAWVLAVLASLSFVGSVSAKSFVDLTLGDVKAEERVSVTNPKPVQLLFQFKTAGNLNARATNFLKERVTAQIRSSGAFSEVSEKPVNGGAVMQITIDNLAAPEAAGQGVRAGLTFGLVGQLVADNYVATLEYVSGPEAAPLKTNTRHRLLTVIGRHADPENAVRVRNADEGITMIVRQILDRLVTDLTRDVGFGAVAAPAPAPAPASAAAPTPAPADEPKAPAVGTEPVPAPAG